MSDSSLVASRNFSHSHHHDPKYVEETYDVKTMNSTDGPVSYLCLSQLYPRVMLG